MRFDLTDLRLFADVVAAGTITGGAAATGLSLAAASGRLRALEARLGAALLVRGAGGIAPTPAGEAMAARAREVLARVDAMERALVRRTELRVLGNTAACELDLVAAGEAFLADRPRTALILDERRSEDIVAAVDAGEVDLGVVTDAVDRRGLAVRPLRADPLVAVLPAGHALAGRPALRLEALADEPWVGLPRGRALQDHLDAQAHRLGAAPRYRARVAGLAALCRLAARGVGVALLPRALAARLAPEGVALVALDHAWARRRLLLCARRFEALAPAARAFADGLAASRAVVA